MGSFKPKNVIDVIIGALLFIVLCPFYFNIEKFVSGGMSTVTSPADFPRFIIGIVVALSLLLMVTGVQDLEALDFSLFEAPRPDILTSQSTSCRPAPAA